MEQFFNFGNEQTRAFLITFAITVAIGPIIIGLLRKLKFGQTVRDDGPSTHLKKTGTPTMGGIIFLIPVLILSIYYAPRYPNIIPLMIVTIGFGLVGFIDDWIKVVNKNKDGLKPGQKFTLLFLVSCIFVLYIMKFTGIKPELIIPFMGKNAILVIPWYVYAPLSIIVLLATTNAVNLTDGLDGLAAGITMIVLIFMTFAAMTRPEWAHMKVFSAIVSGGCFGFLVYNINPAKVIMGDSGSLALGGAVGALAVMMNIPLVLIIAGGIYVFETLSVILQVASYKMTGKRIFKMAPLHHHFELSGWKETRVVYTFWAVTVVFCLIASIAILNII